MKNYITILYKRLTRKKQYTLGENVKIRKGVVLSGNVVIGDNTIVNNNTIIKASAGSAKIEIGKFCSIAHDIYICTFNHNIVTPSIWGTYDKSVEYHDLFPEAGKDNSKGIYIGSDVWIGTKVSVMPGVNIANGAIVGANSVVTRDVEPYSIVAGAPARKIKSRFSEEMIKFLMDLGWWNWDRDKMYANEQFFCSDITKMTVSDLENIIC